MPRESQNSGKSRLKVLNSQATPVLLATRVSILTAPCRSCLTVFTKKRRPKTKTTTVASTKVTHCPQRRSMKNILRTKTGRAPMTAPAVCRLRARYCLRRSASAASSSFSTSVIKP